MIIDDTLLDSLTAAAAASPRLRMNYDLRTSPADGSQRMLNALEPGTVVPVHRHRTTTETVVLLRGKAIQYYYDDAGQVTDSIVLEAGSPCFMMSVDLGRWHRLESLAHGTVIFECKDGAYEPLGEEDVMEVA